MSWCVALALAGPASPDLPEVQTEPDETPIDGVATTEPDEDRSGIVAEAPPPTPTEPEATQPEATEPAAPVVAPPAPPAPRGPKPAPSQAALERQSTASLGQKKRRLRFDRPGSPQRFEVDFKLGPYLPDIDRRYAGPGLGPYATIFGRTDSQGVAVKSPRPGVMPAISFEWQFIYLAGTFGLGTQLGFFRDAADAPYTVPEPGENIRSTADRVTFGMVPITVFIAYRLSILADRFHVPLIPFVKAGPSYAFWWMRNGAKKVAKNSAGDRGAGGVWGWQLNAGAMLRLDFLEPGTAKKLDIATGINHTFVYGEYQLSRLANFGAENSISVGDSTFFAGLGIEF